MICDVPLSWMTSIILKRNLQNYCYNPIKKYYVVKLCLKALL